MKKIDIERMERLEAMVERLTREGKEKDEALRKAYQGNLILEGKIEAYTEIISSLAPRTGKIR